MTNCILNYEPPRWNAILYARLSFFKMDGFKLRENLAVRSLRSYCLTNCKKQHSCPHPWQKKQKKVDNNWWFSASKLTCRTCHVKTDRFTKDFKRYQLYQLGTTSFFCFLYLKTLDYVGYGPRDHFNLDFLMDCRDSTGRWHDLSVKIVIEETIKWLTGRCYLKWKTNKMQSKPKSW